MDNKKFTSYMGIGLAILMVISLIYFISNSKSKDVVDYKIDENTYYTGTISKNKLEGQGILKSPYGIYKGNFKKSRFDGPGNFSNEDYTYSAKFNNESGNSQIKIKLKNGKIYKKTSNGFVEVEENEN